MPLDHQTNTALPKSSSLELRYLEGDPDAADHVRRKIGTIVNGFHKIPYDARDDLIGEAYARVFRKSQELRAEFDAPFDRYVTRTTRNVCIDWIRRSRRRVEIPLEGVPPEPASGADPESTYIEREESDRLISVLRQLSDRCRRLLWRFFGDRRSHAEIAELEGWASAGTSRSRMYECIRTARALAVEGGGPPLPAPPTSRSDP